MKIIALIDKNYHVIPFSSLSKGQQNAMLERYPSLFTSQDPLYIPDGLIAGLVYDELELWRVNTLASDQPAAQIAWRNLQLADYEKLGKEKEEMEVELYL